MSVNKGTLRKALFGLFMQAALVLCVAQAAEAAQAGMAAKGGSIARERVERRPAARGAELSLYRPVVRELGFDFPELRDVYLSARRQNSGLKFETLVKAYIVASERTPESPDELFLKIVDALRDSRNKLSRALERGLAVTKEAARDEARAADARYERAAREAARSNR